MPAIAGEGRALHEAAAAQGIAGVMARQRSSPYLPGVRSRLWRFIAVGGEAASTASGAAATRGAASAPGATTPSSELDPDLEGGFSTPASAPVVALIRRLPLLFDD